MNGLRAIYCIGMPSEVVAAEECLLIRVGDMAEPQIW